MIEKRERFMSRESGFTLVELMVVVAIIGILASVAVPAYVNHVNRVRQGDALGALMDAKMSQEMFWGENNRYASTLGCLEAFGAGCTITQYTTEHDYVLQVINAGTNTFTVQASKQIYSWASTDILTISDTLSTPKIDDPKVIEGFSLFDWVFGG
jgi:type IV pilus assembly protein PilE